MGRHVPMKVPLAAALVLVLVLTAGCLQSPADDDENSGDSRGAIRAADHDDWPFRDSRATLRCDRNMVWLSADGQAYPLNGAAMSRLSSLRPELSIASNHRSVLGGTSLYDLIGDGLELC